MIGHQSLEGPASIHWIDAAEKISHIEGNEFLNTLLIHSSRQEPQRRRAVPLETVSELRLRRFSGLFWPIFDPNLGGNI